MMVVESAEAARLMGGPLILVVIMMVEGRVYVRPEEMRRLG